MRRLHLLSVIGALLPGLGTFAYGADDSLRNQFLNEAPKKWEEYRQRARTLMGRTKLKLTSSWGESMESAVDYKSDGRNTVVVEKVTRRTSKKESTRTRAYGMNSKYAFMLQQEADGQWKLLRLDDLRTSQASPEIASRLEFSHTPVASLISLQADVLPDVVRKPDFRVHNVSRLAEGLVLVVFDYKRSSEQGQPKPITTVQIGRIVLDPDRFWTVRSVDLQLKQPDGTEATYKLQAELDAASLGFPIPKRVTYTEKGKTETSSVADYDLTDPKSVPPESAFTVSAFGLPEPPGVEWKQPTPWWLWAIAVAILVLLLGGLFAWRRRRTLATAA